MQREGEALERLQREWPDFPELTQRAQEYRDKATPEARFVYTIDKILPPIIVNLSEKEAFWHPHKVTRAMHQA